MIRSNVLPARAGDDVQGKAHDSVRVQAWIRRLFREEKLTPRIEISPYNGLARRITGGIWNEDTLPVTEWEAAEHRVVLPANLQQALHLETPVLRWANDKYQTVLKVHRRDLPVIRELDRYLCNWIYAGSETGEHKENYRVLFHDESARWYAMSFGPSAKYRSFNVVTIVGSRRKNFLRNRQQGMINIVERRK